MLEKISGDELLRQKYYAREKARMDEISRIKYAESKGFETGLEKGIEKGKREMAKELLKDGIEVTLVVKYTKLSVEEIEDIRKEI